MNQWAQASGGGGGSAGNHVTIGGVQGTLGPNGFTRTGPLVIGARGVQGMEYKGASARNWL